MQPDENKDNNMNTLNAPTEGGTPNGLSTADNLAGDNQQTSGEQPANEQPVVQRPVNEQLAVQEPMGQPIAPKKSKKGLIISCSVLLILLVVGIVVAVVMLYPNNQGTPGGEQTNAGNEVIEGDNDEEEVEPGEPKVDIEQTGTAEVENGTFSIKDQSGAVMVKDEEMTNITGVRACETIENDIQTAIRCVVSTEDGDGVYVYYPDENVLKFAED